MRVVKTRVFDVTFLTLALVLPSCSLLPKKNTVFPDSGWIDKSYEPAPPENLSDNQKTTDENAAAAAEPEPTATYLDGAAEESDQGAADMFDGEETPADEANFLKAALPGAEESGDHVRVMLVSARLSILEPMEDHWSEVRQDAEKLLGAEAEPMAVEQALKGRLEQARKNRRAAESAKGKDREGDKLAAEKKSLTEELSRREGRALSASVHITVLDEERNRLMAKLEGGRTSDLLSQLKKANENKAHWQKIVAAEKSETERIQTRLVELNSALKGRERDLKEAQDLKRNARDEEAALRRDLKLFKGWRGDVIRRRQEELKSQRKKDKQQEALEKKTMVPVPPEEPMAAVEEIEPAEAVAVAVKPEPVEAKPLRPEDITLSSFDPSASVDEILSKFPEPSHQRAALNLLLWKMTSNDPRRAEATKRLVALRGKASEAAPPAAEPVREKVFVPREETRPERKDVMMVPAPAPAREAVVTPVSARRRILAGSGKTAIQPNAFEIPAQRSEAPVEKPVAEKREEQKPDAPAAKESTVRALEKLLDESPEILDAEIPVEEIISVPEKTVVHPAKGSPAPVSPAAAVVYRVKTGDTLPALAKEMYGDPARWQEIYEANQNVILKGLLEPGQWLLIPRGMAR